MKRIFCAWMIGLTLLLGFQRAVIVTHFKLDQQRITDRFCINKHRPDLQCNGTCFLKKRMKQTEQSERAQIDHYLRVDIMPVSARSFDASAPYVELRNLPSVYKAISYKEPSMDVNSPPPIFNVITRTFIVKTTQKLFLISRNS